MGSHLVRRQDNRLAHGCWKHGGQHEEPTGALLTGANPTSMCCVLWAKLFLFQLGANGAIASFVVDMVTQAVQKARSSSIIGFAYNSKDAMVFGLGLAGDDCAILKLDPTTLVVSLVGMLIR